MNPKDEKNTGRVIADWKCERFLLGELDEAEMEEIGRAMEGDETLRAHIESMARSNEEILQKYPPEWMGRRILDRLGSDRTVTSTLKREGGRSWWAWRVLVPAGAVAVIALAVFVSPHLFPDGHQRTHEVTRVKGESPQLRVYRKTAAGSEQLESGAQAAAHDLILLQYQTDDQIYGVILSVDGRGTITRHLPEMGDEAEEIELQRPHFLDHSYELDDAPSWEVFFLVTSDSPFAVDRVVRAIEASLLASPSDEERHVYVQSPQPLQLPDGFRVERFTLIKESPHEE